MTQQGPEQNMRAKYEQLDSNSLEGQLSESEKKFLRDNVNDLSAHNFAQEFNVKTLLDATKDGNENHLNTEETAILQTYLIAKWHLSTNLWTREIDGIMGQKTRNAIRKNKDQELARISMASRMHLRGPDADGIYTKDDDVWFYAFSDKGMRLHYYKVENGKHERKVYQDQIVTDGEWRTVKEVRPGSVVIPVKDFKDDIPVNLRKKRNKSLHNLPWSPTHASTERAPLLPGNSISTNNRSTTTPLLSPNNRQSVAANPAANQSRTAVPNNPQTPIATNTAVTANPYWATRPIRVTANPAQIYLERTNLQMQQRKIISTLNLERTNDNDLFERGGRDGLYRFSDSGILYYSLSNANGTVVNKKHLGNDQREDMSEKRIFLARNPAEIAKIEAATMQTDITQERAIDPVINHYAGTPVEGNAVVEGSGQVVNHYAGDSLSTQSSSAIDNSAKNLIAQNSTGNERKENRGKWV